MTIPIIICDDVGVGVDDVFILGSGDAFVDVDGSNDVGTLVVMAEVAVTVDVVAAELRKIW